MVVGLVIASRGLWAQSGDDTPSHQEVSEVAASTAGSTYIPVDSWIYPAATRLYAMGYLPTLYLGLRPWTRASLAHMLELSRTELSAEGAPEEAVEIAARLRRELAPELTDAKAASFGVESVSARVRGIQGPILDDSYHLGQTIVNDYGRPNQTGFNALTGFSTRGTAGRFSLYLRGEYQHAPSAAGYTPAVAATLAAIDNAPDVPQDTIPAGPIAASDNLPAGEAGAEDVRTERGRVGAGDAEDRGGSARAAADGEAAVELRLEGDVRRGGLIADAGIERRGVARDPHGENALLVQASHHNAVGGVIGRRHAAHGAGAGGSASVMSEALKPLTAELKVMVSVIGAVVPAGGPEIAIVGAMDER